MRVSGSICFVGAVTALLLMIGTNAVAATPRQQAEQALQQLAGSIKTAEAGKDWQCTKGGPYWKVMNDRFNGAVAEYQKAKNFEAQGMMVPANASYSSAQVSAQSGQSYASNCH